MGYKRLNRFFQTFEGLFVVTLLECWISRKIWLVPKTPFTSATSVYLLMVNGFALSNLKTSSLSIIIISSLFLLLLRSSLWLFSVGSFHSSPEKLKKKNVFLPFLLIGIELEHFRYDAVITDPNGFSFLFCAIFSCEGSSPH